MGLYLTKMKNTKLSGQGRQQRKILKLRADINRTRTQIHYAELFIAGCLGASAALAFVLIHQIFFI